MSCSNGGGVGLYFKADKQCPTYSFRHSIDGSYFILKREGRYLGRIIAHVEKKEICDFLLGHLTTANALTSD